MSFLSLILMAGSLLAPRIHFDSNSFAILGVEEPALRQNVAWLSENPKEVILLEGHCDEWGEDFYNMELGDRRAREVKAYLMENGIDPERIIMVVSYGARSPLNPAHDNEAWRQNRRVEFVLR